ncbi:MAG: hypothetical protein HY743_04200 [Deltaproteobacteria bacterium]|nr:hypothetical protein [Deltaproteobacteria bacterium]
MKIFGLLLVMGLLVSGCATFQHSELIGTDQQGFATGKYSCDSQGPTGSVLISGAGGGWGGAGVGGLGGAAILGETGPPKGNAINFAKSVAIINYSKKLKSIKYDEAGGIIDYEFEQQPLTRTSSKQPPAMRSSLPASFGHQPIE